MPTENPDPLNQGPTAPEHKSSWGLELSVGGWIAVFITVLFGGSALLAAGKAAVDPPKLGVEDGLTFGWIFAATLPLAIFAAAFSWFVFHKIRRQEPFPGTGLLIIAALGLLASLYVSAWCVDSGVKDAVDSAASVLPSPEGATAPTSWPDWADAYATANSGGPTAMVDRALDSYTAQFGVPLLLASLLVGAFAGFCGSKITADS